MKNTYYKEKITKLKTILHPSLSDTADLLIPLHSSYKNMMEEVKKMLEEKHEMSKSELDLLVDLVTTDDDSGILTPTELYERLVFSSGGMTKLLKKLETKKYIIRIENPEDKRSKLVKITAAGNDIAIKAINDVMSLEAQYFSCLNNNEKNNLLTAFQKLTLRVKD